MVMVSGPAHVTTCRRDWPSLSSITNVVIKHGGVGSGGACDAVVDDLAAVARDEMRVKVLVLRCRWSRPPRQHKPKLPCTARHTMAKRDACKP